MYGTVSEICLSFKITVDVFLKSFNLRRVCLVLADMSVRRWALCVQ